MDRDYRKGRRFHGTRGAAGTSGGAGGAGDTLPGAGSAVHPRLRLFGVLVVALVFGAATPLSAQSLPDSPDARHAVARIETMEGRPVIVRRAEREWPELMGAPYLETYDYVRTDQGASLRATLLGGGRTRTTLTILPDSAVYLHRNSAAHGRHAVLLEVIAGAVRVEVEPGAAPESNGSDTAGSTGRRVPLLVRYGELSIEPAPGVVEALQAPDGSVLVWASAGRALVEHRDGRSRLAENGRAVEYRPGRSLRTRRLAELGGPEGWFAGREQELREDVVSLFDRQRCRYLDAHREFHTEYRRLLARRAMWYAWMRADRVGRSIDLGEEAELAEIRELLRELAPARRELENSLYRIAALAEYLVLPEDLLLPGNEGERDGDSSAARLLRATAGERPYLRERFHTIRYLLRLTAGPSADG